MKKSMHYYLATLVLVHLQGLLWGTTLKKVMILDFNNNSESVAHKYLATTITDAIRDKLKKQFAFRDLSRAAINELAEDNFFRKTDYHNHTAALQLGITMKQDFVIHGDYTVNNGKIHTTVEIIDVRNRKSLARFEDNSLLDNRISKSVDGLAVKTAEEMKRVLPLKENFVQSGPEDDEIFPKLNLFNLLPGYFFMSTPLAYSGKLTTDTLLSAKDIPGVLTFGVEYQRHRFLFSKGVFWINGSYDMGQKNFDVDLSTKQAIVKYSGMNGAGGFGIRFLSTSGFYVEILAGGGYSSGKLNLDYSALIAPPINPRTGAAESSQQISMNTPFAVGDFRVGYEINRTMTIEGGLLWKTFFFEQGVASGMAVRAGIGFKLF